MSGPRTPEAKQAKTEAKAQRAQAKQEARAARVLQQEEAARATAQAAAERAFWQSPQGQARAALQASHAFYQIELPVRETRRPVLSLISGDTRTVTRQNSSQPDLLGSIESEGWQLEDVGYVFQQTSTVSRDKLLSTGQTAQVTGEIVGIYLFRRR